MSASEIPAQAKGLADGLAPSHAYVPNQGYVNPEATDSAEAGQESTEQYDEDEDDEYYDDIFEDELDTEDFQSSDPADLTKAYNRQRKLNDAAADSNVPRWQYPKTNTQKPTVNTYASVDDQVKSLTRHAAKIKLDDQQSGFSGSGSRGGDRADRATSEQVLDPRTRMILLQMINRGLVSEIHGCLSTGKEANVYHAMSIPDGDDSTLASSRLPRYISQAHNFIQVWNEENDRINSGLAELSDLHSLYDGFLNAYDSLILEVARRAHVRARVEKVLRDTKHKLNQLYDEDVAAREAFRIEQGDFLPSDIWPGIGRAPMQVQFLRVAGGQLPALAQEQDPEHVGVETGAEPKTGVADDNADGEIIPDLPKDIVKRAFERLKARGGNFA